jgi:hypothetical protein
MTDVCKSLRAITSDIMFEGKRPRAIKNMCEKEEKKKKRTPVIKREEK